MKINLIPEAKQVQKKIQKMNLLSTFIAGGLVVFILLLSLISLGLVVAKSAKIKSLKKDIASTEEELKSYKKLEDTIISLEGGLKNLSSIQRGEKKWSSFFTHIEKATPSDIQFKSLDISGSAVKADLSGITVNSLSRFVESFNRYQVVKVEGAEGKNLFKNVEVSGFTKEGSAVKFSATFEINQEVLWQ